MTHGRARPAVDVVVPFYGPRASLQGVIRAMGRLRRRPGDTLTIVDNVGLGLRGEGDVHVLQAAERCSSYYARNRGAALGRAEWIVFLDADVTPDADLLDAYLEDLQPETVGVLGGRIEDEPTTADAPAAARFATLLDSMSETNTLSGRELPYTQTANCAIRRPAFEEVGGFCDHVRSGGDADICFRLAKAGWEIQSRPGAVVVHANRRTVTKLLRQRARMGAGAAWVNERHPGSFPAKRFTGLAAWSGASFARAGVSAIRGRRDDAILATLDPLTVWAFELGRRLPNRVPGPWRETRRAEETATALAQ